MANSTFSGNTNERGTGAGLHVDSFLVASISDSDFVGNRVPAGSFTLAEGGAVQFRNVSAFTRVERCNFVNNSVQGQGGAIGGQNACFLNVASSTFIGNWASDSGGAISTPLHLAGSRKVCLQDSELTELLYNLNDIVSDLSDELDTEVLNARQYGNNTWGVRYDGSRNSEVLIDDRGILALDQCTFRGNYARRFGGAVSWDWSPDADYTPVIGVRNCEFSNNRAERGGAIWLQNLSGGLVFQGVVASDNVAARVLVDEGGIPDRSSPGIGGFLYFREPAPTSNLVVLRGLTAWNNFAAQGGVVYADVGSSVLMSGVLAWNNSAALSGGVLHCKACDLVATQMDTVRAVDCEAAGVPPLNPAAIQPYDSYRAAAGPGSATRSPGDGVQATGELADISKQTATQGSSVEQVTGGIVE